MLSRAKNVLRPTVHNLLTEQLDTVVLLLVELIGSAVISLRRCCLKWWGARPPNIFS